MKSIRKQHAFHVAIIAVSMLALGACSSRGVVNEAVSAKPASTEFNRDLQANYSALATSELSQADHGDAKHFAMKSLDASAGKAVAPDAVKGRGLDPANAKELEDARGRLVAALNSPNAASSPALAAQAQTSFDCWLEQQEEGWQYDDIAKCKNGFETAMTSLTAPKAAAAPATPTSEKVVYFKFDSEELIPSSQSELTTLIDEVKLKKPKTIQIISYTDLSGTKEYNAKLATLRGQSIEDKFRSAGPEVIRVDARGAVDPVVDTMQPNQENRRAVIIME
jgi:OmpA-OmpF porin, OOP family